ncbi:MAG: hypothetical protein ACD_13C00139G0001 [uncultured bacterium]|uniref:Uncharacterized protein n=6 Tax=Candidatus Woeseibacteriota TaxID=1752722 RepID=A0A0G0T509_9BACT|nr:MAG: hypothetical protein ACD_13C00139G0001 [uncultured bacterium]KKR42190.1 MAG: hypothetical protein UT76_C0024G0008 [Candidatus Woesebacteria bacterium GW2011_GWB1_40_12]KKR89813.1 MAG: hypothetical protein UU39_C0025G0005 [Candidatus Woesebacteria bacterium GW2011_GWD1_41_12]KKR99778.1 MAG: hypothetical protein UU51_C0024G0002 [Microgenomates group bacterium GW2011_GWC1_41_20]KKS04349.1 MAG: hypothetical protein UU57_C0021G0003 [Candidatus Woesebacteria bacterium GW2011_GWE1_41_24]KKS18
MSANDPQILYMILVVPCLFGLTLVGEGVNKLVREEANGLVSIIFGFLFIGLVIFAYFFFSSFLVTNVGV